MGNFKSDLSGLRAIPKRLVFDNALSDRARFVYVFMACKPDDWEFFLEPMAKEIGYSVETLRKYINELVSSGWLEKGKQQNGNGVFGAVEYILKESNFTDTEKTRHGNFTALNNNNIIIENNNIEREEEKNKIKKEKTIDKKKTRKELFEECWLAYKRKGVKKLAFEQWCKLTDSEKDSVMPHIKAYTQVREKVYQKDFERYLRDKVFTTIVFSGNNIVFDPTKNDGNETVYSPICGGALSWNDYYHCYMYVGYWDGVHISDGYTDDNRPDGASITLNNGRGTIVWDSVNKTWNKK